MHLFITLTLSYLLVAVISFHVGKQEGRMVEAKALALALKLNAKAKAEFQVVVDWIKGSVCAEYQRIKNWL